MLLRNYLSLTLLFAGALAPGVLGCGSSSPAGRSSGSGGGSQEPADASQEPPVVSPADEAGRDALPCAYGQLICDGNIERTCDGHGGYVFVTPCATECQDGLGCVDCVRGASICNPDKGLAKACVNVGGLLRERTFACNEPGMTCSEAGCTGPCSPTELGMTNVGCEFWPTVTANNAWNDPTSAFAFGVVVGNTSAAPAAVRITGPESVSITLGPSEARAIALPLVPELKGPSWDTPYVPVGPAESVNKLNGAYRVISDQPIVAYQFNTLRTQIDPALADAGGCPKLGSQPAGGPCYSYSTDASLLLPSHVLAGEYVAPGRLDATEPQRDAGVAPSLGEFLAITASEDNTTLTLALPGKAAVLPWPELPRLAGGQTASLSLGMGQVIELFTDPAIAGATFAGTTISVAGDHHVQVLSGHGCGGIPYGAGPCGHLEDAVLPTGILGTRYVLLPMGDPSQPIPYSARVFAVAQSAALSFDPPVHTAVTIEAGKSLELIGRTEPLVIEASQPVAVVQFASSRGDPASPGADPMKVGSPSQVAVVPNAQYRSKHTFATLPGVDSTLSVVAPTGADVTLDGVALPAERFRAVASSGLSYATYPITAAASATVHVVQSARPIGIVIQGIGPYSSYAYAGGLSAEPVATYSPFPAVEAGAGGEASGAQ